MRRIFIFFGPLYLVLNLSVKGELKDLKVRKNERVIIFAPHPDDEILACGGLIQKVLKKKGKIWIVYLTNGDHNQLVYRLYEKKIVLKPEDYIKLGKIRRKESIMATKNLGIPSSNLIFLGYPDFGTMKIWKDYWGKDTEPFESFLTRAKFVPYEENYSYGKPYIGDSILSDIEKILLGIKPTKIFSTGSYDKNVDHRALYNFLRCALLNLKSKISPEVYVYLVHFEKWPFPYEFNPGLSLFPPSALDNLKWYNLKLGKEEIEKKYNSIKFFKSQIFLKKKWFFSFARENEIFYQENEEEIKDGFVLSYESEKEAEFKNRENISIPYNIFLIGKEEGIEVQLIQKKRFLRPVNYIFYFYGWRKDIPFPDMPKVKISLRKRREILKIENSTIYERLKYEKEKRKITFRVNWITLGRPQYLFFSTEVKTGGITYDFIPWKLIKINFN